MRNDVIMTSLPKIMGKFGPRETKQIIYHSKGVVKSYPKINFLLNLRNCVKSYGRLSETLAYITRLVSKKNQVT